MVLQFMGFPDGSAVKESACNINARDWQILGVQSLSVEDALEERKWQLTQAFLPRKSMDRGATFHEVTKESDMSEWLNSNSCNYIYANGSVNFKTFVDKKEKNPQVYCTQRFELPAFFYFLMQILLFPCKYSWWLSFPKVINNYIKEAHCSPWSCPFRNLVLNCRGSHCVSLKVMVRCLNCGYSCVITEFSKKHLSFYFYLYMFFLFKSQRSLRHCRSFEYFECFYKVLMASNELTFDHLWKNFNLYFCIHLMAFNRLSKFTNTENDSLKMKIHHSVFVINMLSKYKKVC